jgi:GMP synthase (glutamine-hydrolysing)
MSPRDEVIPVLDFGSQYAQLICRRVREQGVYSELCRPDISIDELRAMRPKGIILSGGPSSVYEPGAPKCDPAIFDLGVPVLGICYGMQLAVQLLGGDVKPHKSREYGRAHLKIKGDHAFTRGLPQDTTVWMSHGDQVFELPAAFEALATTPTCPFAAARHVSKPFYGVQFHPEVTHTPRGEQLFHNFLYEICGCRGTWTMGNFVEQTVEAVRTKVGRGRVICGLSGGVDSAVAAALCFTRPSATSSPASSSTTACFGKTNGTSSSRPSAITSRSTCASSMPRACSSMSSGT